MDCKISVTTNCNARCKTCPVWMCAGEDMSLSDFIQIWGTVMMEARVNRVLLNNTGDMYVHPQRAEIWSVIEAQLYKPTIVTTNAAAMDYVPAVSEFIISFNGHDKESYEHTTGLDFEDVQARIRSFYPDLEEKTKAEIHCLIWGETYVPDAEKKVRDLWSEFPGRVRVSYKTENQQQDILAAEAYQTDDRVPCDYLTKLNIWPDGSVIMCAHDFEGETTFGNILTDSVLDTIMNPERMKKIALHRAGEYTGICAKCNYNTTEDGKILYVKG